jgi:hypothetical protein
VGGTVPDDVPAVFGCFGHDLERPATGQWPGQIDVFTVEFDGICRFGESRTDRSGDVEAGRTFFMLMYGSVWKSELDSHLRSLLVSRVG